MSLYQMVGSCVMEELSRNLQCGLERKHPIWMDKSVSFVAVMSLICSRWRVTNFKITNTMSATMDISTHTVHGRNGGPMEALVVVIQTFKRRSMVAMHLTRTRHILVSRLGPYQQETMAQKQDQSTWASCILCVFSRVDNSTTVFEDGSPLLVLCRYTLISKFFWLVVGGCGGVRWLAV